MPFTTPSGAGADLDALEATFAEAEHVVECTIRQHRYLCAPMEGRGIVASWSPGRGELEIVCSTQTVHETRNFFARALAIPEANVRVTARDVGGGFGQKMFVFREECAVVLASVLLGRPVQWIEDRRENLIAAAHSRNELGTVRLAIDADHRIQAITIDHVADVGAYPVVPAVLDATLLPGPYRIPRLGFATAMVWTNTMGKGAYRGPWMFETTAREMAIDHAARVLGIDPVELRRHNLLSPADLPFASPGGHTFDEITPRETLEQALAMLDLDAFRRMQAAARADGRLVGLGVSVYVEPTSMRSPTLATEAATLRIEASGRAVAFLGTTSHGQSVETTMAQIIADELGLDVRRHHRRPGRHAVDALGTRDRWQPHRRRGRWRGPGGVACRARQGARRRRAISSRPRPAISRSSAGRCSWPAHRPGPSRVADVAARAYRFADQLAPSVGAGLEATVRFRPRSFPTWSNAAHVCVVEVDRATCRAEVLRYIVSEDCGRMINPAVVDGQISGGVVQGIGGVLLEDFVYDADGNPLTSTLVDYLLPTAGDVPTIEIGHIETVSTTNPGGHKGMGEGGAIGSHAAVANAVADALAPLGIHVTSTPLGPEDIHRLMVAAGVRESASHA